MDHTPVDETSGSEVAVDAGPPDDTPASSSDSSGTVPFEDFEADADPYDHGLSLEELAASLEDDDGAEQAMALEGLASLEPEIRVRIIEGLGRLPRGPGLSAFLAALTLAEDAETSSAASRALEPEPESGPGPHDRGMVPPTSGLPAVSENRIAKSGEGRILSGSLVSAVDAEGRATIAISTIREGIGRSAVFRCDVRGGVLRAMGRNEPEPTETGGLIHEAFLGLPSDCDALRDVPELALRLLGGILLMGPRSKANASVRAWIDEILGPGFRPQPIPIPAPSLRPDRDPHHRAEASLLADMPLHVRAVLDACPNWLDASALTVELAEEIELREGKDRLTDPARHAGAYRYLFEHRLIHRLDLYARMLLWMAWFWRFAEEPGLSDSAIAIAAELGDAQFAVPSHPFSRALTTRSLDAARLRIRERRR